MKRNANWNVQRTKTVRDLREFGINGALDAGHIGFWVDVIATTATTVLGHLVLERLKVCHQNFSNFDRIISYHYMMSMMAGIISYHS